MLWCGLALLAGLGLSPSELAEPDSVELEVAELDLDWSAPPACPDAAAVRRRTSTYLGGAKPLRELSVTGVVSRDGEGWSMQLEFDGHTRLIRASSCEPLAQAAAVIISLAVTHEPAPPEPEPEPEPPEPEPSEPSEPEPEPPDPEPEPEQEPVPEPEPTPSSPLGLLRAEAGVGVGITPTLTTARLATGVVWHRARFELAGTLWAPADAPELDGVSTRALVTMGSVQVRGCGVLRRRMLRFPLCGGIAMGAARLDELGSTRAVTHRFWSGATVSGALVWRFSRIAGLFVGPEVIAGFGRTSLPRAQTGFTYDTGLIGVRAAVGIELVFPSRTRGAAGNRSR